MTTTTTPKISVVDLSFDTSLENVLSAAASLGFSWIQTRNVGTELAIDMLDSPNDIEAVVQQVADAGLQISSASGGFGSLFDAVELESRIDNHLALARLTRMLGCTLLTGHIGKIPADGSWKTNRPLRNQLDRWVNALQREGVQFAVETGPEHGEVLADFLATMDTPLLQANLDPANFTIFGFDPISCSNALYNRTVHMHVKDANQADGAMAEAAVGTGVVPMRQILAAAIHQAPLQVIAVEREEGNRRIPDIEAAKLMIEEIVSTER